VELRLVGEEGVPAAVGVTDEPGGDKHTEDGDEVDGEFVVLRAGFVSVVLVVRGRTEPPATGPFAVSSRRACEGVLAVKKCPMIGCRSAARNGATDDSATFSRIGVAGLACHVGDPCRNRFATTALMSLQVASGRARRPAGIS
jgi:hypothetical protein